MEPVHTTTVTGQNYEILSLPVELISQSTFLPSMDDWSKSTNFKNRKNQEREEDD